MCNSRIVRLLALTLALLFAASVPALADPCVVCGKESGSDAYVCTACLLDLLKEEDITGGLTIDMPTINPDGTVTFTWQDAQGNAPYNVYYELLQSAPVPFGWTVAQSLYRPEVTLTQLVPGMSYVVTVEDAAGNRAESVYYAPIPGTDTQIGAKIRFKTMWREEGARLNYRHTYSASEIMADTTHDFGLYLRLSYSILARTRNYAFCITVEAPNGFADVIFSGHLELHHGKSQVPVWGFIELDDFFGCLERYYGGIPTGDYKVTMHFNGNVVHGDTFHIGE